MIKEAIQSQIDLIEQFMRLGDVLYSDISYKRHCLQKQLLLAKSIQDIEKEAFEAGIECGKNIDDGYDGKEKEFKRYINSKC